jgi:phage I-like protein
MSEANQTQPTPNLTAAQKDTARRLGMSEKEYAKNTAELIRRGKIDPNNLK